MSWTAAAIAGGAIIGGTISASGARSAGDIQGRSSERALEESARQYDLGREDLRPYREAGEAALLRVRDLLGIGGGTGAPIDIAEMDPGYQFRLGEGERAMQNAARAGGMSRSGAALKAATRYGQGFATNAFDSVFNRLAGTAGIGQTAANTGVSAGQNYAGNVGNIITAGGNARGASAIAQSNAYGGAINSIGNYYGQQQMLDRIFPRYDARNYVSGP